MKDEYDHSLPETFLDVLAVQIFEEDLKILNGFNLKHHQYYMELILRTNFLGNHALLLERFYHIYHKTSIKPRCANVECNERVAWHQRSNKHNKFCGKSCAKKVDWRERRQKNQKK